ncbi:MAG: hypothetical protein R3B45_15035 [Bdellovibrionota bacterium]
MMKKILLAIWIVLVISLFYLSSKKSYQVSKSHYSILDAPPFSQLTSASLDILTIGHRGLYDDFINIWLLQILADKSLPTLDVKQLNQTILQVTRLHPKIEAIYMIACFSMALDLKHPQFCEEIILDGLKAFPQSWRLPMTQGFVYLNLLKLPAKASAFYNLASSRKDSPPYVASLAKKLINREEITPEETQQALDLMLKVPGGSKFADFLNTNMKRHNEAEPKMDGQDD